MTLSTDDIVALHQLYARYCHAVDDGDGPAFSGCFTADGALDAGFGDPIAATEALSAFASTVASGVPGIRHQVSNIALDGDGGRATGRAYLYSYAAAEGGPQVITTGRYEDTLCKLDGEWRFELRRFVADTAPA
jgi:hypothetical protein